MDSQASVIKLQRSKATHDNLIAQHTCTGWLFKIPDVFQD